MTNAVAIAPDAPAAPTLEARRTALAAGVAAGLLHGGLMLAAFPPLFIWPLALLAAVPLTVAAAMHRGPRSRPWWVAVGVMLGSAPAWSWLHRFLVDVTLPGFIPLGFYLGCYPALFVALLALLMRRWPRVPAALAAPVLLVGVEFVKAELVFGGYAWHLLGQPTLPLWGPWNPAHAGGVSLVSFTVAIAAGLVADWLRNRTHPPGRAIFAAAVLTALCLLAGRFGAWRDDSGGRIRLGLVQTNMPQSNKLAAPLEDRLRDFARWLDLSRGLAAAEPKPDVIVWPETMFMGDSLNASAVEAIRRAGLYYRVDPALRLPGATPGRIDASWCYDALMAAHADTGVPMLIGALATEGLRIDRDESSGRIRPRHDHRYNSAFLLRAGKVEEARYDKMELMPFGEMIPLVWRWPALQQWVVGLGASGMAFDLSFGRTPHVFAVRGASGAPVRIVTPICFEAAFSRQCRRLAYDAGDRRADLLINMSNDGWFGWALGGREAHLLMARWRAIELGLPVARSVNTGISCWIDPTGAVHGGTRPEADPPASGPLAPWSEGSLIADIPVPGPGAATLYGMAGDWPGWTCFGLSLIFLVTLPFRRLAAPGEQSTAGRRTNSAALPQSADQK